MLYKIVFLLLACLNSALVAQNQLEDDFFNHLQASVARLSCYQDKVEQELSLLSEESEKLITDLNSLEDQNEGQEVRLELLGQIKSLRNKCSVLVTNFINAHKELIFKYQILCTKQKQYIQEVSRSLEKTFDQNSRGTSIEIKELLTELSATLSDKQTWQQLKNDTTVLKQLTEDITALKIEQQALSRALHSYQKSSFINQKKFSGEQKLKFLEASFNRLNKDQKTLLKRYQTHSLDECWQALVKKEIELKQKLSSLCARRQKDMEFYNTKELQDFTIEEYKAFSAAGHCVENYRSILAQLVALEESCKKP